MASFTSDRFTIGQKQISETGEIEIDVGFRPVSIEINADYHLADLNEEYHSKGKDDPEANTMSVSVGYGTEDYQIVSAFGYYSGSSNQHFTYEGDDHIIYLMILDDNESFAGRTRAELVEFTDNGFKLNVLEAHGQVNFTYKAF